MPTDTLTTSHVLLIDGWDDDAGPLSLPVEIVPAPTTPEGQARIVARYPYPVGECDSCGDPLASPRAVALVYGATDAPTPEAVHLDCLILSDHLGLMPRYVVEGWDVAVDGARHLAPSPYGPGAEGWALAW